MNYKRILAWTMIVFCLTFIYFTFIFPVLLPSEYSQFIRNYINHTISEKFFVDIVFVKPSFWIIVLFCFLPILIFVVLVWKVLFKMLIVNSWLFIFMFSTFFNSVYWHYREITFNSIYFIEFGNRYILISNVIDSIFFLSFVLFLLMICYSAYKFDRRGEIDDFMSEVILYIDNAKSRFTL